MKTKYLFIILMLCFSTSMFSQWIDWIDETNTRIVVSNALGNDDPTAVDDQEKDLLIGDFDNDSFTDLIVVRKAPFSNPGAKTDLLFMNRNGVLEDETNLYAPEFLTIETDARDAIAVDVNNDTWLDVFIVSTFGDQPKLYMNQGNDLSGSWLGFIDESATRLPLLTLSIIQFCAGWSGDLTGNGAQDIYMINYDSSGLSLDVLFINDGTGHFTEEAQTRLGALRNSSFGTGVEFHDVDNDNDLDVVKNLGLNIIPPFNTKGTIVLFNNGDGTFTNFYKLPGDNTYMFTAGDLDNDGLLEFYEVDDQADYVNSVSGYVVDQSLTINQSFLPTDRTDNWGGNVKMVDLDGDGDLDVGLSSVDTDEPPCLTGADRRYIIFENEGLFGGNLIHPYGATMNPWNVSTYDHDYIDINNDGYMDMILGGCDGYQVFIQDAPPLAVDDLSLNDAIGVYPNPNNGSMQISLDAQSTNTLHVSVYSLTGSLLSTISFDNVLSNVLALDLRGKLDSKTGMYFLKLTTDQGAITKKVLIE